MVEYRAVNGQDRQMPVSAPLLFYENKYNRLVIYQLVSLLFAKSGEDYVLLPGRRT